jgi:hypothetical protein
MSFFKVIVELFPVEWSEKSTRAFLNEQRKDHAELSSLLKSSIGIYAFYNSELEIIYLGKTKSNLLIEMQQAYMRDMPHYKRYYVNHPNEKYKPTSGAARALKLGNMMVWQAAWYFSAYSVEESMIDDVEKLLIRIAPNDLLNRRMEGNGSLQIHVASESE